MDNIKETVNGLVEQEQLTKAQLRIFMESVTELKAEFQSRMEHWVRLLSFKLYL